MFGFFWGVSQNVFDECQDLDTDRDILLFYMLFVSICMSVCAYSVKLCTLNLSWLHYKIVSYSFNFMEFGMQKEAL